MNDDTEAVAEAPQGDLAAELGMWVTRLAEDALAVARAADEAEPGSSIQVSLRAAALHLLHLTEIDSGIEDLAAVEAAMLLRLAALQAEPATELDSEAVLQLRAETTLLEALFDEQFDGLRHFAARILASYPQSELAAESGAGSPPSSDQRAAENDSGVHPGRGSLPQALSSEVVDDGDKPRETSDSADGASDSAAEQRRVDEHDASEDEPEAQAATGLGVVTERLQAWSAGYTAPLFGTKPHDALRLRAFVNTRLAAYSSDRYENR